MSVFSPFVIITGWSQCSWLSELWSLTTSLLLVVSLLLEGMKWTLVQWCQTRAPTQTDGKFSVKRFRITLVVDLSMWFCVNGLLLCCDEEWEETWRNIIFLSDRVLWLCMNRRRFLSWLFCCVNKDTRWTQLRSNERKTPLFSVGSLQSLSQRQARARRSFITAEENKPASSPQPSTTCVWQRILNTGSAYTWPVIADCWSQINSPFTTVGLFTSQIK